MKMPIGHKDYTESGDKYMKYKSKIIFVLYILFSCSLFSLSINPFKKLKPEIKVITEMQDKYDALPETLPAIVVLPASGTSAVPPELITEFNGQISQQMVLQSKLKPVVMTKYLSATFLNNKAANPFTLLQALAEERYTVPLRLLCKPFIFKNEQNYIVRLAFYRLNDSFYPIEIIRSFTNTTHLPKVIASCLEEFSVRYFTEAAPSDKKKILIREFTLEFRKLVELVSGEFEFVPAPFIQQTDFTLKDEDDYFSLLFGYILSSTDMFETFRLADFKEFAGINNSAYNSADYVVTGRVQLTDQVGFLYINLINAKDGIIIQSVKHPLIDFSLSSLIDAYREIGWLFSQKIFPQDSIYLVPHFKDSGNIFYYRDRLIGWDTLKYFFLPSGMHVIQTQPYSVAASPAHTYYILLDTEQHIFTDKEGKYAWNLLQK
jgi:hypothetical protein